MDRLGDRVPYSCITIEFILNKNPVNLMINKIRQHNRYCHLSYATAVFFLLQNTRVYIREPIPGYRSWTGPGFMRVMEGDAIEFSGISVDFPMYYDIVIRYDPRVNTSVEFRF